MNCRDFEAIVGAEPHSTHPDVLAHIEQCPACKRYREEMLAMDGLIYRALEVDTQAPPAAKLTKREPTPRFWRMAASVLVSAITIAAASIWLLTPRETFAADVIKHINHESASLVKTSETANSAEVASVLAASGVHIKPNATHVSYVQLCPFRGHRTPHLVVQTDQGPVTVLVMADEPQGSHKRISASGYEGVVVPAPRGVLVVVGQNGNIDEIAHTVLDALEYS